MDLVALTDPFDELEITFEKVGVGCVSTSMVEGDSIDAEIVPCVSGAALGMLEQTT